MSLRGDNNYAAEKCYEVAVVYAGRRGLTQDQALAHECFADHFRRRGLNYSKDAEYHLTEALKLYEEWGAHAKVEQLQARYDSLLGATEIKLEVIF